MNNTCTVVNTLLGISFFSFMHISGMEKQPTSLVLFDDKKSSHNLVKDILALTATCKRFNKEEDLHIAFGKFCKNRITKKNELMRNWSMSNGWWHYWERRCGAFTLIYAGADNNAWPHNTLFRHAIEKKDKKMITALFENDVNPNQNWHVQEPDWFHIEDIDIAKMFIAHNVDLQQEVGWFPNVLWCLVAHNPSPQLIEFYLNNNVDTNKRDRDGNCLLHKVAIYSALYLNRGSCDDYAKIIELLLKATPDLINAKNNEGKTPLDLAYDKLEEPHTDIKGGRIAAVIISLESHGGKKV